MSISTEIEKLRTNLANAYDACETKSATIPDKKTMANLQATILSITQGDIPKGVAIDGAKWTEEWEAKGENGTIIDVVIGDALTYRREIGISVSALSTSSPCVIDWGDGTTTTVTSTSASIQAHTYSEYGHFVITIDNNAKSICCGAAYSTSTPTLATLGIQNCKWAIRRVRQFGNKLQSLNYGFYYCTVLNSPDGGYEEDLPPLPPTLTSVSYAFDHCLRYRGKLPYVNHLTKVTNCQNMFSYMTNATGTAQILPPNVTTATGMYSYDYYLTCIPYDVFPDSLATKLTGANQIFQYAGYWGQQTGYAFPKMSHLTALKNCAYAFQYCSICKGPLPELPSGSVLNDTTQMFSYIKQPISISKGYFDNCTGLKTTSNMFRDCFALVGEVPDFPPNLTTPTSMYMDCLLLGGTFPTFPETLTSLYEVFYSAYSIAGQIDDIPAKVTNLTRAFCNCHSATGKIPALGNITKITAGSLTNAFSSCTNITDPPDSWFSDSVCAAQTSFELMFAYCSRLKSFPYDLDNCTASSVSCSQMFRECCALTTGPKKLPPNVTNTTYMFAYCFRLADPILHLGTYTKLTNISYMYQYAFNIYPMVEEDGTTLTMDYTQLYSSTITTYTAAFSGSSPDALREVRDACVLAGKSATYWGGSTVNYSLCYYYKGGLS